MDCSKFDWVVWREEKAITPNLLQTSNFWRSSRFVFIIHLWWSANHSIYIFSYVLCDLCQNLFLRTSQKFLFKHIFFFTHDEYILMKYNRILKMFTKIMGIYECSFPWCFFRSCVRDFLVWKMCSFTKLYFT